MGCSPSAELPSALGAVEKIAAAPAHAFFLDYDGTLSPIVSRPEEAVLAPRMRDTVRALAALRPVTLVSGRDRLDLERRVGIPGLGYVGSHGFDVRGPAGSGIAHEVGIDAKPTLDAAEALLRESLRGIDGALLDRKRFGVAAHYRLVAERDWPRVEAAVRIAVATLPGLRIEGGKRVFEVRPDVVWNKGAAVLWLLEAQGLRDALAVHLGDDDTDETVFAALADRGVGIFVGEEERSTGATLRLRDVDEVGRFLDEIVQRIRDRS